VSAEPGHARVESDTFEGIASTPQAPSGSVPQIEARALTRRFAPPRGVLRSLAVRAGLLAEPPVVQAVSEVSLEIARGEVLGLVGESGCGKSTLGRMLAGILRPSAGEVRIAGEPLFAGDSGRKSTTRVQMVFQDPFASLDPRMRVGDQISEGPLVQGMCDRGAVRAYVAGWLERVGLDGSVAGRFPHQFSGGQRQRIALARALAMQPDTLICDEPVASLDVSIQAQVLNLLLELRRDLGLTLLFISHHLGVVRHVSDRVAVMYLGRVVELGPTEAIYRSPAHPYTRALLDSVPQLTLEEGAQRGFRPIQGELPSPLDPPSGCHFHLRCPHAFERCQIQSPPLGTFAPGRQVACWLDQRGSPVID